MCNAMLLHDRLAEKNIKNSVKQSEILCLGRNIGLSCSSYSVV